MRFDAVECGKRIKALREEKRLTQMELAEQICITTDHLRAIEELAEQICITTDHLRAIERGRRACSIDLLVDLSLFFEVTLDHLILGRTPANEIIRAEILQAIGILQNIKNTL